MGRTYIKPAPQGCVENFPFTHCANPLFTQAFSPELQEEAADRVLNLLLQGPRGVKMINEGRGHIISQ